MVTWAAQSLPGTFFGEVNILMEKRVVGQFGSYRERLDQRVGQPYKLSYRRSPAPDLEEIL